MTVEVNGKGAYVIVKADGLSELASKVNEYCQQGYVPHGTMQVVPSANLRPTEYLQVVVKNGSGG